MKYKFPLIRNINDVLPAIDGAPEFLVSDRGDHKVITYHVSFKDTFPDVNDYNSAIRRECRGIAFANDGRIIRRPFHKFFNLNEREETQMNNVDFIAHTIFNKLDGSMIAPYKVPGKPEINWGTKAGFTDFSLDVYNWVAKQKDIDYNKFVNDMLDDGVTPIFEWMAPNNRVVIDYGREPRLVLTAIRDMETGEYFDVHTMNMLANAYSIPVVDIVHSGEVSKEFLDALRTRENLEGVVIRFKDGHMLKVKCDWYLQLHKTKELLAREKDVVSMILNESVDDIKPILQKQDFEQLEAFEKDFSLAFKRIVDGVLYELEYSKQYDKKSYALERKSEVPYWQSYSVFKFWDKEFDYGIIEDYVKDYILKNSLTGSNYESKIRPMLGNCMRWAPTTLG